MVSVDNQSSLINHVRKCFTFADDSGFCELLLTRYEDLTNEKPVILLTEKYEAHSVDTDDEKFARLSPECPFSMSTENLWTGTSTDASFDGSDRKCPPTAVVKELTDTEVERYFPVKSFPGHASIPPSATKKSSLTLALEQAAVDGRLLRTGLFADYSKHDGRPATSQGNNSSCIPRNHSRRCFTVWFWRVIDIPRISIRVQPCAGTTVAQFVGLSLWQYFNDVPLSGQDTILPHDIERFDKKLVDRISVYMLDSPDEGVDSDFPPLEPSDLIHKYEFEALALVEHEDVAVVQTECKEIPSVFVTVHLAQGVSTYRFKTDAHLSDILDRAVQRRDLRQHGGYEYHLESWPFSNGTQLPQLQNPLDTSGHGQKLDLRLQLSDVISAGLPLRFVLIRDNSRFDPLTVIWAGEDDFTPSKPPERLQAAFQLRQYRVAWLKGLFPREVQLTVSADGIRIDHVNTARRPKLFSKPLKPVVLTLDELADCQLVYPTSGTRLKSGTCAPTQAMTSDSVAYVPGKVHIRITHSGSGSISSEGNAPPGATLESGIFTSGRSVEVPSDAITFQHLLFETQWTRARAIYNQLNSILEHHNGKARQLYVNHRLAS